MSDISHSFPSFWVYSYDQRSYPGQDHGNQREIVSPAGRQACEVRMSTDSSTASNKDWSSPLPRRRRTRTVHPRKSYKWRSRYHPRKGRWRGCTTRVRTAIVSKDRVNYDPQS